MRRRLVAVLGLILTLTSSIYVVHVLVVDYEAVSYGFPLPWLAYVVNGMVPVHLWVPSIIGLAVDYVFWLAVSFGVVSVFSMSRRRAGVSSQ
jgi:hypothetical protein